jgi:HSP20 family molecular chaperone IbpA
MQLREALGELPETVFADLLESDDAYLLVVDLPGATADTVDVTLDDGRLRIEARREKSLPTSFRYVTEERSLFLDAELPLPPDVSGADADGEMERGVLTLRLPKSTEESGQRIPIS